MIKIKKSRNEKIVKAIETKLKEDPHCPCRLDKNEDTLCPCKEFREQEIGKCHCGLYEKVEVEDEEKKESISIYEQQKQILSQCHPVNFSTQKERVKNWCKSKNFDSLCLMCREKYDFTVLENIKNEDYENFWLALETCIQNRGEEVLDVIIKEDVCRIWVKQNRTVSLYLLFDASSLIVDCGNFMLEMEK